VSWYFIKKVKTVKERFTVKHEKAEDWAKAKNFIPLSGEICIYEFEGQPPKIKVGNGKDKIEDLPFISESENKAPIVQNGVLTYL